MNFYIQVENGVTVNHPAAEDNLLEAFGKIPSNWELIIRNDKPYNPPLYKTFDNPEVVYEKVDGVWTEVWRLRDMTAEEKLFKQEMAKKLWAGRRQLENFSAWVFDESVCDYVPPFPKPQDGKDYFWQGTTSSWVEKPPYPEDGKTYRLNFTLAAWEEVVI